MNSPLTPEDLVNSFTVGNQIIPQVVTLIDGSYYVVWQSPNQDGDGAGIVMQHFTAQGEQIGIPVIVNSTAANNQGDPSIAATEDGGFVVVWESQNQDAPGDQDIGVYGQRFAADGTAVGPEFQVNAVNTSATQFDAAVAGVPGGGFAVVYTDDFGDNSSDGIRIRFYDAAGVPAGNDVQVNTSTSSNQVSSVIASIQPDAGVNGLTNGGLVVVWQDDGGADGSGSGVFAQIFAPDGTTIGTEFVVNTTTSGSQFDPSVVGLDGGRFVVVWTGADSSSNGVFAQVFEGDGTAVGTEFLVNVETASTQDDPEVTATTDGGFVVVWESNTSGSAGDGSSDGVFARRFDADGVALTGEFQINEETQGNQLDADVAALANGQFVTVWQTDTNGTAGDGDGTGIAQRIFGDPAMFPPVSSSPLVEAFSTTRTFSEADVNAGPQRLDAEGAVAFSDGDSADLDGGRIVLGTIAQSVAEDGFLPQDSDEQVQLGLDTSGAVSLSGADVLVNGTIVGTLTSDGANGAPLIITLNANSTVTAVEILLENLTFANTSDDPRPNTVLELLVEDGDGASSEPVVINVDITPNQDTDGFIGTERQVNTVTVNNQSDSAIASLSDGGYISVWTSTNQDNPGVSDTGVFAQRFDANGGIVGQEFQVNVTITNSQFNASVAGLADGGWVIVWDDDTINGIRLNRYDATGALTETELQVETQTSGNQSQPQVTALSTGGYVVTWTSQASGGAGDGSSNAVIAQIFDATGATVGGEVVVNQQTNGAQDTSAVSALSGGRFVVVWQENDVTNGDGSSTSVSARIIGATGLPEGAEFQVNSFTNSSQTVPKVATLADGDFVVVWLSNGQDGSSGGIYYQRYTDAGVAVGDEVRVNDTTSGDQTVPDIIALDTGGFIVSWVDTSTPAPGNGADVFVQAFDADGTRLDTEVRVNTEVSSTQDEVVLAALPGGNYVVQWTSETSGTTGDGNGSGIFQQIIGDPSEIAQSNAPTLAGLDQIITLDESAANAGTQLVAAGALALIDLDSPDLDGGLIRFSRVVTEPVADEFNAPDGAEQDDLFFASGGRVSQAGNVLRVDGIDVATLTSDGLNGTDLTADLLAGATLERVETLLNALTYQTDSDNPRDARTYSLIIEDGDGGLTQPLSFEIRINQEAETGAPAPVGAEDQVNQFTTNAQDAQHVTALADGGWVVVWRSSGQDADADGVFGQRYDSEGVRSGPEFQVNTIETGSQNDPVVTALEDGGWVVVWTSQFADAPTSSDVGVVSQRYAADGTAAGPETIVNITTASSQFNPSVATIPVGTAGFPNGGYVVVHTSDSGDGSSDAIILQRFATDGTPVGGEITANTTTAGNQGEGDVAVLSDGRIAVTYISTSVQPLFVRVFNPDGTEAVAELEIAAGAATVPSIAATADGGFVVAWADGSGRDGSGTGITAQRFDATGAPVGASFVVNEDTAGTQNEPDVIGLDDGRFVIAWRENTGSADGSGDAVVAQVFSATGERLDGQFILNQETTTSTQFSPELAALPGGNFVTTFTSVTSGASGDGSSNGVFQQIFGDPADFTPGDAPEIQGLTTSVTLDEAAVNAGFVRIDADATVAVGDTDSPDFDGGILTLRVDEIFNNIEQLNAGDDDTQDLLGLVAGDVGNGDVTFSGLGIGDTVSVDGTVVGTIAASGQTLQIVFNTNATQEAVEAILGNLAYSNPSDAPASDRRLSLDLTDGDGQSAGTQFIDLSVTPEVDLGLVANGESRVNAYTNGEQTLSEVVELTGGGLVVVWASSPSQDGDSIGIFAQRYDANGVPQGPEFAINTTTARAQTAPDIAATADGGFVVVWESTNQDNPGDSDQGIIAQRFDANGVAQGSEIIVNTNVTFSQFQPAVAGFVDGGFIVTYISDSGDGSADAIVSQRFDAIGAPVGVETVVNTNTVDGNQFQPDVATLVDGLGNTAGHVIVFSAPTSGGDGDGSNSGVFAQRFDATGAPAGAEFQVNTTTFDDQSQPSVVGLAGGGFVVVWTDDVRDGSVGGVFAQMYDVSGAPIGLEFRVNTDRLNSESDADVTALSDGGFLVSWTAGSGQDGSSDGVFAQRFAADGSRIDSEFLVNEQISSSQNQSSVTTFGDGFAASWTSQTSSTAGDGSGSGIFLNTFTPTALAQTSPVLEDVDRAVTLFADDIVGGAQVLDNGVAFSDPDTATFNGGTLEVYYTQGGTATDQLSIAVDADLTIAGSTISLDGIAIATLDATLNGANGAGLLVTFNAAADADAVQAVMEHLAFGSTDIAANLQSTNRGIGFLVTDGTGGQTSPDSIFVTINSGASNPTGLAITDFGDPENQISQLDDLPARSEADLFNAPQLIDANVDFDDFVGTSFDGGRLTIAEVFNSSPGKQLSVQDQGTGAGQIGFDGTNVSFEGTVIGTVNASANGVNGASLQIDFNANATEDGIEALAEALTFGLTGTLSSANQIGFDITITNQAGNSTSFNRLEQEVIRDRVIVDAGLAEESQVNTFTAGTQQAPRIAELSDGGYVVVWNSTQQDNPSAGDRGIFAQLYNAQGQQVGVEFQVNDISSGDQIQPRAEGLSNGTFVLLWTENTGRDGSGQGVFAQIYQNDGTVVGNAIQINEEISSTQNQPEVTDLGGGRFLVVWTSATSGNAGDGNSNGIFGRVFDATGTPEAAEFQINTTTNGNQNRAQVTTLPDGDTIVVWEDNGGADGSGSGIFAQRIDSTGALVSFDGVTAGAAEVQINTITTGEQTQPDVAVLGTSATLPQGGFVVVWSSPDTNGTGIFGQIYDASGAAQGAEFQINAAISNTQSDPIVVGTPDGGFVVAWADSSSIDGSGSGVTAQRFNADGTTNGVAFLVNEEVSSTQNQPDLAVLTNGTLASVWTSVTSGTAGDGSGNGVFQALFDQPAPPVGANAPVLEGVDDTLSFDENIVNAAPQLLNQDGAISLTDADSTDLDGGSILVQRVVGSSLLTEQLRGPGEGAAQDVISVLDGNGVSVSGTTINVNGNAIGTIVQDGTGGAPFEIDLSSANATPEAVEAILAQLAYQNLSSDPSASRTFAVQVTDGDGGSTGSELVTINVIPGLDRTALPRGGEEQVNTFITGSQSDAATSAIYDAAGAQIGYVVVWQSADQDRVQDASPGIFAQRFDLNGDPVGAEFLVHDHTEFSQTDPTVTGLPTGGFVVGWTNDSFANPAGLPAETSTGTFARIFDAAGQPVGGEFIVNDIVSSTQNQIELTAAPDGTIVAVYTDFGNADGSGQGVFLRRFDDTGTALGASVQVNTQTASTQSDAAVAILDGGRIAVSWTSSTSAPAGDGSGDGVFARLFEADGTPVGPEFQVNTSVSNSQNDANITALSNGDFLIVWTDNNALDGSGPAVLQQRFDANGVPVGAETLVNQTTVSSQSDPIAVALDTGGWVVAWSDNGSADGSGTGVFAQVYAADGSRVDGEFQVNTEFSSTQSEARLVALPGGGFTVVWTSTTSGNAGDGSSNGVFQQVFAADGAVQVSVDPVLNGLTSLTLDEADVNASGQLIAGFVGLGDLDSADFDGGTLTVSMVVNDVIQPQFSSPDDGAQDQLGFTAGGSVAVAGAIVSVNGTAIGTLQSDGVDGAHLTVALNANATPDLVELLLRNTTYANTSDDPETARLVAIQLTDGDGGFVRDTVSITITPEQDGAEQVGSEVLTNAFTLGDQSDSHVATLADGGYVIVWNSTNQDATGDNSIGVFAQRYDASGAPVGGEFQVNTNAAGSQSNAQVVGLSTGGFVVAWDDASSFLGGLGFATSEIVLQVYDSNGQAVGGEVAAPRSGQDFTDAPSLAAFDNGDFVLVYDARNPANGFTDSVFVQRFNDQGGTVGTTSEITPLGSAGTFGADVAVQADGTYVVVFTSNNLDDPGVNDSGVFLQRFAADDSQIGGPIQVNTFTRFSQFDARVAALEGGGYVVVFQNDVNDDFGFSTTSGIYAQRFDDFGNPVGEEFLVNEVVDSSQTNPDVVALAGGGFAISYDDNNNTDGSGVGVFVQQYDAQGNRIDGALQVNTETSSTQNQSAIAALADGNFVVSFTSATSGSAGDGSSNGVFHQILGDPADFSIGGAPVLDGVNRTVTYTENTLNGIPQLIDADGAVAVSDPDSADFDGGAILVSNIISSAPLIDQINAPDNLTQDQLGLRQTARITISGNDVSVDSTVVATIEQNGQDGDPFELRLNANADAAIVELLVENLTYRNISDDPLPTRDLRIQVTDGDGGASEAQIVTITITPTPDAAQPVGGEQVVNTTDTNSEDNPEIVTLPGTGGDFIVVWQSFGTDGDREGLFAQRFDVNGNKLARDGTGLASGASDEFQINTTTIQDQASQEVAAFSNGGWVVTWVDDTLDGSGTGIVAQVFNPDGTLNGSEILVNDLTSSNQLEPHVAVLTDDTFVVTWQSPNSAGAGDGNGTGVLARHFSATGTPLGSQFVVNTETSGEQTDPAITQLNDGGFLITWRSATSGTAGDGEGDGVFAQRFDATATAMGTEFQINTSTRGNQNDAEVTVLSDGNIVVTWTDSVADLSGQGVFATIIAPDGTPIVEEFRVNDQRISSQSDPVVAALDTGGFVIAWTDNSGADGSGQGVFAQQYDANGARVDSQFQVNTTTAGTQNQPDVAGLPGGGFVVGWNGSVLIQIYGNEAPTISPVAASGDEDTAIVLDAAIFDAGFFDPDGNTLQAIRVDTFPTNGTLALNGTPVVAGQEIDRADLLAGNLVYTGSQDFNGTDSFLWTGSDGLAFSNDPSVAANITVNPVNDAPGLDAGANTSLDEGAVLTRTLTLTDPDVDTRTFTVDYGDGSALDTFNSASLSPQINHVYATEGTFTVTVTVDDNAGDANSIEVDTFTVDVVNAAPNAVNDSAVVSEDGPAANLGDLTSNDSDPGNDPLTVVNVAGVADTDAGFLDTPIVLASGATVTFTAGGDFIYNPNGAFESLSDFEFGSDSFTYTIEDDAGLQDTATVNITIDGQNDNPDAVDDAVTGNDDTPVTGNVLADNGLGADSDIDTNNVLSVSEVNGSATDVGQQITLASGALLTLNTDGSFDYNPNGQFAGGGADSFDYTLSDGRGGTDTATVNITINGTNQAPVALDDTQIVIEDVPAFAAPLFAGATGEDFDPDGDPISVVAVNNVQANVGATITLASGASLLVNAAGTFDYSQNGIFDSLAVGEQGNDTFTYTISDGNGGTDTATVTILVDGVNDAPTAFSDSATTDEDSTTNGNVLTNDTDPDASDTLVVSEVGGSTLAVGTATATTGGGSITVQSDGSFVYDPGAAFNFLAAGSQTTDSVTYAASDGNGGSSTASLIITVTGVNDGPTAQDDLLSVGEDATLAGDLTADNGVGADSDPDTGDIPFITSITVGAVTFNPGQQITLASGAVLVVNGSGTFTFDTNEGYETLNVGEFATEIFTYTLQDSGGLVDTATVTLVIDGNADLPVAGDDAVTTDEDNPVSGAVLGNDTDADEDVLSVSAVNGAAGDVGQEITLASGALLTLNADGTFDYDPNGQFEQLSVGTQATDSFTYEVSDGNGGTDVGTVTVTIDGVNDAPVAGDDTFATNESTVLGSLDLFANNGGGVDSDIDQLDMLSITEVDGQAASVGVAITLASGASLTVNADGSASYDPNGAFEFLAAGASINETFTYTLADGNGGTDTGSVLITIQGENDAPDAVDDGLAVAVDVLLSGNVLLDNGGGADSDPDTGDVLQVTELNGAPAIGVPTALASGALVTLNADGTFDYDQNGAFSGLGAGASATDSFAYTLSDGNGGTDTATVTITIGGSNQPPVALDDGFVTDEATAFTTGNVLLNDTDPNTDVLSVSALDTTGTLGLVIDNGDGTFDYDPNGQFETLSVGQQVFDTFSYTVSDGNGGFDTAVVTVTVNGVNDVPVAVDDTASGDEDTTFLIDVLANDTDVDAADTLTIASIDAVTGGTAVIVGNQIQFTGAPDVNGTATISYSVSDGQGGSDTALVTLTLNPINDAPVVAEVLANFLEDDAPLDVDLLSTANDVDGDDLDIAAGLTLVSDLGRNVAFTVDAETGLLSIVPGQFDDLGASDSEVLSVSFGVTDGAVTVANTATITIQGENDAPDAVDDGLAVAVDVLLSGNVLLDNGGGADSDPDTGDVLQVTELNGAPAIGVPTALASGALVTLNADGTFDYDQNGAFSGLGAGASATDSFAYTLSDGNGGTDTATVTITIGGSNQPPVALDDGFVTDEATAFTTGNVLLNDTDPNTDVLSVSALDTTGTLGLVIDNGDGTFDYDPNGQFETLSVGQQVFDTFSYTVSDGNGGFDTAVVTVTVNGVNDVPVAVDDTASGDEDTTFLIDVLANDTDVDAADTLTIASIDAVTGGTAVIVGNQIQFTGAPDVNGTATISYSVSDGQGGSDTALVTLTLNPINDAPVVAEVLANFLEDDAPLDVDLLSTANDVDGDDLDIAAGLTLVSDLGRNVAFTVDAETGLLSIVPGQFDDLGASDSEVLSVSFGVTDGAVTVANTATITIQGENDAPDAVDDGLAVAVDVLLSGNVLLDNGGGADSDPDTGDVLQVTELNGAPAIGVPTALASGALVTLNADGTFDYDQNGAFSGLGAGASATDSFAYTLSDGNGGTDTATVTITIGGSNQPPVALDDGFVTDEATAFTTGNVLLNDTDPNTDVLSVSALDTTGTLGLVIDNGDGTFDYDPNGQFETLSVGQQVFDTFSYTVSDGNGGFDTAVVTVTVNGVNDVPVAVDDTASGDEDTTFLIDVLANDTDVDAADTLTIASIDAVTGGTAVIVGNQIQFTGAPDVNGTATISYSVSDGQGGSDTALVTLTLNPINDAPVLVDTGPFVIDENTTDVGTVTATDVDNDPLTYAIIGGDDASLFDIDQNTGELSFIAAPDFEMPDDLDGDNIYEIQVQVSDGSLTDDEFVFVEVADVVNEGGSNVIQGTNAFIERLIGTAGEDEIRTGGGVFDTLRGLGGADVFVIEETVGNFQLVNIADYQVGVDSIDLQGRSVVFSSEIGNATYLILNGDFDTIIVNGAPTLGDIDFV